MGYFRKLEEKRRFKRLLDNGGDKWYPGTVWFNKRTNHYIRVYPYSTNHGFNYRKYLQKQSNRRLRRKPYDIYDRCEHKKQYDLWWKLY